MKSLTVDNDGILSFQEFAIPQFGECQALVKMRSCGVCNGTDTKLIHRNFKNFNSYPAILGHEGVGEVIEIGKKVENLHVGDIVLLPFLEEAINGYTPGWGAYSEYAIVGDANAYIKNGMGPGTGKFSEAYFAQTVIKKSDKIDPINAAMIITFREVLSAIKRFQIKQTDTVVIFGAGPVGLCFTQFCKLLGVKTVITTDISDEKIQKAADLGADITINSQTNNAEKVIKEHFPEGVDIVIDAVGVNALILEAMKLVKNSGKICTYGISAKLSMDLDWSSAPYNWTLQFCQWPNKAEEGLAHSQIMAWINAGVLKAEEYISHVFPFTDTIKAFELVERREQNTKKIVISF
ncbi:MAG: zinc-dependent alcohol dehydrogenase [Treponemataceae bacterium]